MTDPARVAGVIGGVADELDRWSNAAAQGAEEGHFLHRGATEEVLKADRLSALSMHHALERAEDVAKVGTLADEAVGHAEDANHAVAYRVAAVAHAQTTFTREMLRAWRHELQAATEWLARARERVRQAELWVMRAQAEVTAARSLVSRAESALRSCNRDPERRNCNAEANNLRRAQAILAAALADLQRAQNELRLAIEERTRAERRTEACHGAVGQAQAADEVMTTAAEQAGEARHDTALARDHAAGAVRNAARAAAASATQRAAAEHVARDAATANDELRGAETHLRSADGSYASARRLAFDASAAMSEAIRRLRVFDQASGL